MTRDDHQQDINDPRELGTRLGGTKMLKERRQTRHTQPRCKGAGRGGAALVAGGRLRSGASLEWRWVSARC